MPTTPLKTILDRDRSKVLARKTIQLAAPLLRELVNDATNVFARCFDSSKGREGEDVPVLFSYLHIIEMTDAIEVLVSEACTTPIILCLRSSFEALLSVKYILQRDYKRRSSAYIVTYAHQRMQRYKLFDPDTQIGSEFLNDWEKDKAGLYEETFRSSNFKQHAKDAIKNLENLVNKDLNKEAELEYLRLKEKIHKKPEWYQLFGGPSNLRELAKQLNYRARYDLFYRYWSSIVHAENLSRFLTKTKTGKGAIRPLRSVDELVQIAGLSVWIMLEAKQIIIKKFRPGEELSFEGWYTNEIRKRYLALSSDELCS